MGQQGARQGGERHGALMVGLFAPLKEAAKCLLSHWALVSSARALIDFKMQAGEHSEAGEDREVLQKAGAQVCTPPARAPR
jgi:hypothetical protein